MNIWIMRHSEAGFNAQTDQQRSLTNKGHDMAFSQGKWLATRLQSQQVKLDKVIVSPYLRAQQTFSEVFAGMQAVTSQSFFGNEQVENWQGITPSGDVDDVIDYLEFLYTEQNIQNVLIISHLPLVFDLVSTLTHNKAHVHFYPAVIAEVNVLDVENLESSTLIDTKHP
ncbi:phosphohistidine phosphatase SixA [Otariodibacter oris]|uniref:Phosphohistidine phosphatase SixA n=1 Tax=Otariodibacter oris TaxID=1032623 RepID=A0A420XJ14_9PAST|nr:phosphohistidine phosphatase SixA [Otariodibacter oris]QGM81680.1 phosphohistidine phosphatase SixA [Otariodibacter oris]RKR77080.1 phosphohistidine phosphatase SixA [Otariodibacter oris]